MIKRIAHVCILARDLVAAERFYCEGLGLRKCFDFVRDGRIAGFYLEIAEGNYLEVFPASEIETGARFPVQHFCLETDDLDAVADRLRSQGYEVTEKTLGCDQSWQIWTTDPSGVRIEFHQYTDESCQKTGRAAGI